MRDLYQDTLVKQGVAESRVADLEVAMDRLHSAMSKLDLENLRIWQSKTLEDRLDEYATSNPGLRRFKKEDK